MGPSELLLRDLTLQDETDSKVNGSNDHYEEQNEKVDVDKVFAEEFSGWRGYIEWEDYPEKRAEAAAMLAKVASTFPPPPEFQLGPIPNTNPVLEGVRWKMWHKALGGPLKYVPEESWLRVIQEKHRDMLHLLQFPYNGEPPKVRVPKDTKFWYPGGLQSAKIQNTATCHSKTCHPRTLCSSFAIMVESRISNHPNSSSDLMDW